MTSDVITFRFLYFRDARQVRVKRLRMPISKVEATAIQGLMLYKAEGVLVETDSRQRIYAARWTDTKCVGRWLIKQDRAELND